ncbi:MAG TPA: hypothetical protein VJ742_10135, partial [Nitrososphaera sp.]|nr:hypothetical protein [Nitrososphaera sp.]
MTLLAGNERTEVWTGTENITAKSLDVLRRIRSKYDLCTDFTGPLAILSVSEIREAYVSLHERGIKVRIITE